MDVIRALGATLWKMLAGDILLTLGALGSVLGVGLLAHTGVLPGADAPFLLAGLIVAVLVTAVGASTIRETRKRSDR